MNIFQRFRCWAFGTQYVRLITTHGSYCCAIQEAHDEVFVSVYGSDHVTLLPKGKTSDYYRWKPLTRHVAQLYDGGQGDLVEENRAAKENRA
jgi:hypothetical protein